MTTNVFDKNRTTLAADSRWSLELPHAVLYVDDAPFEKICKDVQSPLAFMFAGDSAMIAEWKGWMRDPNRTSVNHPPLGATGIAICIVDCSVADVVFDSNQAIVSPIARFAGTGAYAAHACWKHNQDPIKAVESAKLADRFSGGTTKFLDTASLQHNLSANDDFGSIRSEFLKRGMAMYFQNPAHLPLAEAAKNDPVIGDALEKVASGAASLKAPSPSAENEWPPEKVAELRSVLGRYVPAE